MTDKEASESVEDQFRKRHQQTGHTIATYFPPEADWDTVQRVWNRVVAVVEGYFHDREGWEPFSVAHPGDVLRIDGDRHVYLSTSCLHDTPEGHEYCQSNTGLCGNKVPASCKTCGAGCVCPCHKERDTVDG